MDQGINIEAAIQNYKKQVKKKRVKQKGSWINLSFDDWERLEYEKRNKGEEDSQEEDLRGL